MNNTLLTAVSVIAIVVATPAIADSKAQTDVSAKAEVSADADRTKGQKDAPHVTNEDIKEGWNKTKKAVSDTAEDAAQATEETYEDIKAVFIDEGKENLEIRDIVINKNTTATAMIGAPVYNGKERVGTVKDIIVDREGKASMVVVADGEIIGAGKLAAFDYSSMVKMSADGDILMPLTEENIDQAAEFSYDRKDYSDKIRVIPSNGYSVAKLLDSQIVDTKGEMLGEVDNIQFDAGQAKNLIVGFDKILGLGGKKAVMDYKTASIVRDGDSYDFQLSAKKTMQFKNYKKSATN